MFSYEPPIKRSRYMQYITYSGIHRKRKRLDGPKLAGKWLPASQGALQGEWAGPRVAEGRRVQALKLQGVIRKTVKTGGRRVDREQSPGGSAQKLPDLDLVGCSSPRLEPASETDERDREGDR